MANYANAGQLKNGWLLTLKTGLYGTDYLQRALITAIGLGANRPQDAIYPTSTGPTPAEKYSGSVVRVMHFPKGRLPPVNGFWSLTMYTPAYFFYDNPLHKYTVSARNTLVSNADGSTDLYVSHVAPARRAGVELAAGARGSVHSDDAAYDSKPTPPTILDRTWAPPPVLQKS